MEPLNLLRWSLLFSVVVYFIFEHFDKKQIKDEREELIHLKTYELVHKVTTTTLLGLSILYLFFPWLSALYAIMAVVFAFLYTEIIGKFYFRRKF